MVFICQGIISSMSLTKLMGNSGEYLENGRSIASYNLQERVGCQGISFIAIILILYFSRYLRFAKNDQMKLT
jgi:hypothetical protein